MMSVLAQLRLQQSAQTVEIPVTTSGVGFLANECHARAVQQQLRAATDCGVNQLHRVSLAQHALQLHEAKKHGGLCDPTTFDQQDAFMDNNFRQQTASQPQNFMVIADLVNNTQVFTKDGQEYRPYVPEPPSFELYQEDEPPTSPTKRRRPTEVRLLPGHMLTFNNLRDTVLAMSDPATPVLARYYFIEHNPLPGARYRDDLLVNRDEIIPPGYR
jgi:hypothetical protein